MAPKRKTSKRTRHGTRSLVLKALEGSDASKEVRGAEIRSRVAKLSGRKIPDYSIYQALRTLVRRKALTARRIGREYAYRVASTSQRIASRARAAIPSPRSPAPPKSSEVSSPGIHKLALGEIVVIEVDAGYVETATNLHGQLVIQRHRRP